MFPTNKPVETVAWRLLTAHYLEMQASPLSELFESDPQRFEKYHLKINDILVDFSKTHVNEDTIKLLMKLAEECELSEGIEAMMNGILASERGANDAKGGIQSARRRPNRRSQLRSRTHVSGAA